MAGEVRGFLTKKQLADYVDNISSSLVFGFNDLSQLETVTRGEGYFGVKRIGMIVGNPRKLP